MGKQRGITLIALVLTIIILLILAVVAVATLTGNNGLLTKAETAVQSNKDSQELEKIKLAVAAAQLAGEGTITKDNLENELKINFNDNTITIGEIEDGWSYNSYKIDKSGEVDKLLPKEYQQVEYIESSGIQYIDTEYIPNEKTRFEIDLRFTEASITNINSGEMANGVTLGNGNYYRCSIGSAIINGTVKYYFATASSNNYGDYPSEYGHFIRNKRYIDFYTGTYGFENKIIGNCPKISGQSKTAYIRL